MMRNPLEATVKQKTNKKLRARMWEHRYLYLMLVPALILMALFHYYPMYGILVAFKNYKPRTGILGSSWVGLKYFERMFREATFLEVFKNTLVISGLKLLINFPMGIVFALLLNELTNLRYKKVMQTVSYLPHFISWIVLAGIVQSVLSLNGPVNNLVSALGGERVLYLTKSKYFTLILILSDMWKGIGWGSIVYLAAIAGIPTEQYESAQIDGASKLQCMRYITLPALLPVALTLFILRVGHILNAGRDQILNLYSPIVYDVADVLDTYTYRVGLIDGQYSYSTAIGLFKNVVGFVLLLTVNRLSTAVKKGSD